MSTYEEIYGKRVKEFTSDPTLDSSYEGQVWYNSNTETLKSVVSFASNLYTYISINENKNGKYRINYTKTENVKDPSKIKNDIAREVISYFNLPPMTMIFNSDIPSTGTGLAASSSYMVAAIAAALDFLGQDWSQSEICELAVKLERKFNPLTGYQDAYGWVYRK